MGKTPSSRTALPTAKEGAMRRGRGWHHPHAKLTKRDVELIFELREEPNPLPLVVIAEKFEVSEKTIRNVLAGRRYFFPDYDG